MAGLFLCPYHIDFNVEPASEHCGEHAGIKKAVVEIIAETSANALSNVEYNFNRISLLFKRDSPKTGNRFAVVW